jgi:GH25 family lysozyme M1 (1,4-beta-N-acetylmuramidase)
LRADAEFGPLTRYAFEALGFALGLMRATLDQPGIPVGAQRIIVDPALREAGQLRRARERAPKLARHTVAFDGAPTFWGLAKPLLRARERGWSGTLQSSDRRKGVAERYGKRSQAALFDCRTRFVALGNRCPADCAGNCNPANPPGASSHECRADGTIAFGNRAKGTKLPWWELGLDVSDTGGLLRELADLGYQAKLTYPNSPQEAQHVNFTKNPGPVLPPAGPNAKPSTTPRPKPRPTTKRVLTGIDVSNHQPDVDWEKVKAAGHTFALTKVSEGLGTPDRVFGKARWKAMRDAGLVRGAYHFARPQKGRDPRAEVKEFLRLVERAGGFEDGDLVPVLDFEDFGAAGKLTPAQTLEWARGFVEEMRLRVGRRPIIYTGAFWRDQVGNPGDNLGCRLWLAAFVKDPKPFVPKAWADKSFAMWQHTDTGRTRGVPGNVDLNRLPGGQAALRKLRF